MLLCRYIRGGKAPVSYTHLDVYKRQGQNYDYNLNGVFFKDLELSDPEVYMDAVGADLGETAVSYTHLNCLKIKRKCSQKQINLLWSEFLNGQPIRFVNHL